MGARRRHEAIAGRVASNDSVIVNEDIRLALAKAKTEVHRRKVSLPDEVFASTDDPS